MSTLDANRYELKRGVSMVVAAKAISDETKQEAAMQELLQETVALLDKGVSVGEICEILSGR